MLQQTIQCSTCRGTIGPHWQMFRHATCKPPILERAARAMVAPPAQDGGSSLTWCKGCQEYHMGPHTPKLGRHTKRAVGKLMRKW